ncbi:hypothetical protein LTR53_001488 [Teratosphaeriaceae sp. CCFEE 6253]|nr:hypothetical protein LTR53_001488 [Teratosphaeriaceae sp. CCFEE 6253]
MPLLKLKGPAQPAPPQDATAPRAGSPAQAASPAPSIVSAGPPRLKSLKLSQAPTPATEQPGPGSVFANGKKAANPRAPASKKRAANDDLASAPKRVASSAQVTRKPSVLKIKPVTAPYAGQVPATPLTAGGINKLKLAGPRKRVKALTTHNIRREIPKRETGVGYDSEDSEREEDPAVQQGLILRMQAGEDADILRNAITEGKIGLKEQGGVDASIRFLTTDLRRAVVKIKGRMYAAALVDLPCIVESLKSWDKKGWWKVADVCQMLLVLGPVQSEAQIRDFPLPREVDRETMAYAHGLTPPMHNVRRRRFRQRVSYRQMENVEEEVERLLKEDEEWERQNGKVTHAEYGQAEWERVQNEPDEQYDTEMDAEGDFDEVYDDSYAELPPEDEVDADALEAELAGAFAEDSLFTDDAPVASDGITASPTLMNDPATPFTVNENTMVADSPAPTPLPARPDAPRRDEASSDEDESDDDDDDADSSAESSAADEDALERAAARAQQLEEVADLEREIEAVRVRANAFPNQLLKKRELDKLGKLEGDLKMKRVAFGLEGGEGED